MAERAPEFAYLLIVNAFERETGREDYDFGKMGNRWRLLINRSKNIDKFEETSLGIEEGYRYAHSLGFELLDKGESIPLDWFGNNPIAIKLGKIIWDEDINHDSFLHIFVSDISDIYFIEIYLTKRLPKSKDYKELVKKLFMIATEFLESYKGITISIFFRETVEFIANFEYYLLTESVTYKDEHLKSNEYSKLEQWL